MKHSQLRQIHKIVLPPLLKAYLRMNAKLGGAAYYDEMPFLVQIFLLC
jgi:hypothetical protein